VVDAVREGTFRIYAAATVNDALEILTNLSAGERKEDGAYPEGSVNFLVDRRLKEMSRKLKTEDRGEEKRKKEDDNDAAPKKEPAPLS